MELHHPIMSKLWYIGGRTKRKKDRHLSESIFGSTQSGAEILSYVEVYNDIWIMCECSCVDCDRFASWDIWHYRWQSGAKNIFVCLILLVCRSVWCCVKHSGVYLCRLWQVLVVQYFRVHFTGWYESNTLTETLPRECLCILNHTST